MGRTNKAKKMKILTITIIACSITMQAYTQDYLQYNTGDSSQIFKDLNTLLTYRNWEEFEAPHPNIELAYSKDKKDRRKYDSLNKIESKKYYEGKEYRSERSLAVTRILRNEYFYKELNKYKEQLIPSLWYDYIQYKGGKVNYIKMLALLDLSQSKKDTLLQDKETPLAVRARLGDKEAEREIIRRFNEVYTDVESQYFEERSYLTNMLLYIDTKTSLDAFFEMLDSDRVLYVEYDCNRGICWDDYAVANVLLWNIGNFYPVKLFKFPPESLVGREDFLKHPDKGEEGWYVGYTNEQLQPYYRELEKLIKKLYDREVTISPPYWDRSLLPKMEEW